MHDFFDIVGLSHSARGAEIRRACRLRTSRPHPDIIDTSHASGGRSAWLTRGREDRSRTCDRDASINFVRMETMVDRMRRAFFGAGSDCPSFLVRLTPWQVLSGAPVMLDVPLPHICDTCVGRGEVTDDVCEECAGTGIDTRSQTVRLPLGTRRLRSNRPFDVDVRAASSGHAVARVRVTLPR